MTAAVRGRGLRGGLRGTIAAFLALTIAWTAAAGGALDVVFLVDSSGSTLRSDPAGARHLLIEAFSAFAAEHPGDRFAIAGFSGWEETSRSDVVLLPFTEVPADEDGRKTFIGLIGESLARLRPSGVADPNAALGLSLAQVLRDGDDPTRSLWVVLITDGEINVVEGATARELYIERAEALTGSATPEAMASVAADIFFEETLPALRQAGVSVTAVRLAGGGAEPQPFFERMPEEDVITVDGPLLAGPLRQMLRMSPRSETPPAMYGQARASVPPGGEARLPFRVLPYADRTVAMVFGSAEDYSVSVNWREGGPVEDLVLDADSQGALRMLNMTLGAGEYDFVIVNASDEVMEAECSIHPKIGLTVALGPERDGALFGPAGRPLRVGVSVVDSSGKAATDAGTLKSMVVDIVVEDQAEETGQQIRFSGKDSASEEIALPVENLGAGVITLVARLRAFPDGPEGDEFIYNGPRVRFLGRLVPAMKASFAFGEAFVGQMAPVTGTLTALMAEPPSEAHIALEGGGESLVLTWTGERYEGKASFASPGVRSIAEGDEGDFPIIPGDVPALTVREREIRLLSAEPPHEPLNELVFGVRFVEKADGYEVPVIVEVSVGSEETPELVLGSFNPSEQLALIGIEAPFTFELRPTAEAAAGVARVPAVVRLGVMTGEPLPKTPGTIDIGARSGAGSVAFAMPITLDFVDYWPKMLMRTMMYWIPALVVLLLLLWWLLLARFKRQLLRVITRFDADVPEFHRLADLCIGSGRWALGTPEVDEAAAFKLRGLRLFGGRASVRAVRDGAAVRVNDNEARGWVRLRHGDEIVVENPEGAHCRYWYFGRQPTAEELEAKIAGDAIVLGPDDFVIEGL